ncbi:MAG: site-2 protease family protein [Clostridia bacterium]|nr:site-2 protease family protein [Clostridia bacterium]
MFSFDKRTMYILAAILILAALWQYGSEPGRLMALCLTAPGVLVAITFHEFAHGFAAYKLGDDTAKNDGRLSLNPFAHLDPIGTLMLLVAGFGWGKPVEVNPRNYNRNITVEKADAIVSIAGPAMNFILAVVFALIYCAMAKFGAGFVMTGIGTIIFTMIGYTISVNIGLGVFNLLPLPPLDGSKVIIPFLSYNAKEWFQANSYVFYIVFLGLYITGLASSIISPIIGAVTSGILKITMLIFGL